MVEFSLLIYLSLEHEMPLQVQMTGSDLNACIRISWVVVYKYVYVNICFSIVVIYIYHYYMI